MKLLFRFSSEVCLFETTEFQSWLVSVTDAGSGSPMLVKYKMD